MLTAMWWPWYEFELHARVPARSFRPVPSVDGGLLTMRRRASPLVADRKQYKDFVKQVFTGRGHGLREILEKTGHINRMALRDWLRNNHVSPQVLPQRLTAQQWASLWHLTSASKQQQPRVDIGR
jgi:23S rRNA (adenine-N6)-dimethyltransferase